MNDQSLLTRGPNSANGTPRARVSRLQSGSSLRNTLSRQVLSSLYYVSIHKVKLKKCPIAPQNVPRIRDGSIHQRLSRRLPSSRPTRQPPKSST